MAMSLGEGGRITGGLRGGCQSAQILVLLSLIVGAPAFSSRAVADDGQIRRGYAFENPWIATTITTTDGHLGTIQITNRHTGRSLRIPEAFTVALQRGRVIRASNLSVVRPLTIEPLKPDLNASRFAERETGERGCMELTDPKASLYIRWCGVLRKDSAYFRQEVSFRTDKSALPISEICLINVADVNARVAGTVKGSPVVDGTMFFAFEHPLSISRVEGGRVTAALQRDLPLHKGESVTYSSVVGVTPVGQTRRAFADYLERERAHPYRPFLNYNSWYDIGYGDEQHGAKYDSAEAVNRIRALGNELVDKRHVHMDSFVFDDGWDNTDTIWTFNSGFPNGFIPEQNAAARYGAGIGVWFSPWGGYDKEKRERVAAGRNAGYEVVNGGLALSGSRYYQVFDRMCTQMIERYDVNYFKLDGAGNANEVFPGSQFDSDFDAAIHLIRHLRAIEPSVFINVTTGTEPSPFWLFYADSIWRGGEDHGFAGIGSARQRWITYRDAQTYTNIVQRAPLFPLNSLMLHGIIYAQDAIGLNSDPKQDFSDEVHSFFGSGTELQEMYITPSLLSVNDWNTLAETAIWARKNASILRDTHWIGGDPGRLEVYGWAAWDSDSRKGIIVLRNPSNRPQEYLLDVQAAFELPPGAPVEYVASSPWKAAVTKPIRLLSSKSMQVRLAPFEVRTLDAQPRLH